MLHRQVGRFHTFKNLIHVLGGAPFNFACRVNSLGDRGIIISRIGRDDYGRKALEQIASFGMDVSCLQQEDRHPTGTVKVRLDDKGNHDFLIDSEVAYDFIDVTYELLELAAAADCFSFGTLAQRAPTSRLSLDRLLEVAGKGVELRDGPQGTDWRVLLQ